MPPPRSRGHAGDARPHGPGGINIRDHANERGSRGDGRNDQGGRRSHDDGARHGKQEGRGESQGGESKKKPPHRSPSPPSSKGGDGGKDPARSGRSHHAPPRQDGKQRYDAREHITNRSIYVGPRCFGHCIREEETPKGIKLAGNLKAYNGVEKPNTWLQDFFGAVQFAGGTPGNACRLLPLYLTGPARQWLADLPEKSIHNWFDLEDAFNHNFEGTYKRPYTAGDLQRCIQKKEESSREFLSRWLDMKNSCEGIGDETAILAYINGLERGSLLRHTLTREKDAGILTLNSMIATASSYAAADDDARGSLMATAIPNQSKKNNKRKNPAEDQKEGSDMVAMTFQQRGQGGNRGRGRGGGGVRGQ